MPASYPAGRPFVITDPDELQRLAQAYFDSCDPHIEEQMVESGVNQRGETIWAKREVMTKQRNYTLAGLARALGVDRHTLVAYRKPEHYNNEIDDDVRQRLITTVHDLKLRCEEYAEDMLYSPYANGAKFNLQNNHDWEDRVIRENEGGLFGDTKLKVELVEPKQAEANGGEDTAQPDAASSTDTA